jgi:streptogramin lyase
MSTVNGNNLYRINPIQKRIPHYTLPEGTVNSFADEPGNILWIGTVKGLLRYDRNKQSIRRFVNDPHDPSSLSHNTINSIAKDKEGNIWIGTNKGLNMLNRDKQTFTRYVHNPNNSNSLFSDYIFEVLVDSGSNLWLVTSNGLDHLNRRTGKFTHYLIDPKDTSNSGIFKNGWKKLLVYGFGFRQLDQINKKFKTNLNLDDLLTLYTDTDNELWIGSINGIFRYNAALDSFLLFEDPGVSNMIKNVYNILEDDHKNLWLSVSDGILRINAKRNQTSLYGVKYGIPGYTNIAFHSGYKGQNGEFFFGNSTGFYSFFPDEFTRSSTPPQININNFRLANQLVKPTKNGPLYQPLSEVREIRLNYDQNVFSFDFAGINYSSPEDNIHLFMLEGYNNTWHQVGAERTAYFFNVPPGNYVFRVKSASSNGIWAEKRIHIIITPPWWSTWWFYTLCILTITASVYALFRYRLNQKLKAFELRNTISRDST